MTEVLHGLFSWSCLIGFLVGLAAQRIYLLAKAHYRNVHDPLPDGKKWRAGGLSRVWVAGIVTAGVLGWCVVETENNGARMEQLATDTANCQREFFASLKARSQITSENDELSQEQRQIVFTWIHDLIFPPEPFASMKTDDPRRQDYGIARTIRADEKFRDSFDRQDQIQDYRDLHPLPDPTCGK